MVFTICPACNICFQKLSSHYQHTLLCRPITNPDMEGEVSDTFDFPRHADQYERVLLDVTLPDVPLPFLVDAVQPTGDVSECVHAPQQPDLPNKDSDNLYERCLFECNSRPSIIDKSTDAQRSCSYPSSGLSIAPSLHTDSPIDSIPPSFQYLCHLTTPTTEAVPLNMHDLLVIPGDPGLHTGLPYLIPDTFDHDRHCFSNTDAAMIIDK
jgi:hypothetical protein